MKKTTMFPLYITFLLVQWFCVAVQSAGTSEAKVTRVVQNSDNVYMVAVEDPKAESGWAVHLKKNVNAEMLGTEFLVLMHARPNPKAEFEPIFSGYLSVLLEKNNDTGLELPKDIASMIFPGFQGKQNFKKGTHPIREIAQVHTKPSKNQGLFNSEPPPFEVVVYVLILAQSSPTDYTFKVYFDVGRDIYTYNK